MTDYDPEMDAPLANWLQSATRKLSPESAERVRNEITAHYESARNDALAAGADRPAAIRRALESLGELKAVNRKFRKVLLTEVDVKLLQDTRTGEAGMRNALKVYTAVWAVFFFVSTYQRDLLDMLMWAGVITVHLCWLARAKTPAQGRLLRYFRLVVTAALPFTVTHWRIFVFVAVVLAVITIPSEWRRAALRRKLPADEWPVSLRA